MSTSSTSSTSGAASGSGLGPKTSVSQRQGSYFWLRLNSRTPDGCASIGMVRPSQQRKPQNLRDGRRGIVAFDLDVVLRSGVAWPPAVKQFAQAFGIARQRAVVGRD